MYFPFTYFPNQLSWFFWPQQTVQTSCEQYNQHFQSEDPYFHIINYFENHESQIENEIKQHTLAPSQPLIDQTQKPKLKKKRRGLDKQKQLQSAKKNSQSNIVNQMFSFYSNHINSGRIVLRGIQKLEKQNSSKQKIMTLYYNLIQVISSQRGRKYVNKQTLYNFCDPQSISKQIPSIEKIFEEIKFISIQQLCCLFRQCFIHYMRNQCVLAVIDSKRISMNSKKEHLKRRRMILKSLRQKINGQS